MNRLFKFLSVLFVVTVLVAAYRVQTTQASIAVDYQVALYHSLDDHSAASYFVAHNCTATGDFRACPESGVAFQVDERGLIRQVYFYVQQGDGFSPFSGELPFGIDASDTMADVQRKLGHPKVPQIPMLGWEPELPSYGGSPDHIHYWAVYEQYSLTVVYNTPLANDLNASIQLILISVDLATPSPRGRNILT
jgi:hypothetical protein